MVEACVECGAEADGLEGLEGWEEGGEFLQSPYISAIFESDGIIGATNFMSILRVPQAKQLIQRPFHGLNSLLDILLIVLRREGLGCDAWPSFC